MKKLLLEVETLEITTFEPAAGPVAPEAILMTGSSGYCNTCVEAGCHWTE